MSAGFSNLQVLSFFIAIIVGLTIHEFAHAWIAYKLGDSTAKYEGRMSLNPIRHLDPLGTLLLIIFLYTLGFGFGWGKPVPVNPYNLRHRYGEVFVSLAGPISNFLLATVVILCVALVPSSITQKWTQDFLGLIDSIVRVNITLGIFNLVPIPPLDGSKVLFGLLSPAQNDWKNTYEKYSPVLLVGFIIFGLGILVFLSNFFIYNLENFGNLIHGLIY